MSRRELIFLIILITWIFSIFFGIFLFPETMSKIGYLFNLIPIFVIMISITPRCFSRKYNNWLETSIFKNKSK